MPSCSPGPKRPTTGPRCQNCPVVLTARERKQGMVRCPACRVIPGPKRTLSSHHCASCPTLLSVSQYEHGMKRCKPCRRASARPLERRIAPKAERQRTTDDSVWIGAERESFTQRMQLHFALLRPGVSLYSGLTEKGSGKRLGKRTANRSAI